MKSSVNRIFIALFVSALMSIAAMAATKGKNVTFLMDVVINGTTIKKGEYKVIFDDQSGEMSILRGKTVIAKTKAYLKDHAGKADSTEVLISTKTSDNVLLGVRFAGESKYITVTDDDTQHATPQQ